MRNVVTWALVSLFVGSLIGCQGDEPDARKPARAVRKVEARRPPQVAPPLDLKAPPSDATKTESGLAYKRLVANAAGVQPKPGETVLVRYTGWRRRTGETFFTTGTGGPPIAIDVAHAAAGFREVLPLLHKGEKAVLWVPQEPGAPEPVAYEVELVDVLAKPADEHRATPASTSTASTGAAAKAARTAAR